MSDPDSPDTPLPPAHPSPIFILASQRSFTSVVCAMLGQHPEVYSVPEINLFCRGTIRDFLRYAVGHWQYMLHGLWRCVAQLYAGEQTMETVEMARRWVQARVGRTTQEVYEELCRKAAPLRICDKSPAYAKNTHAMARMKKGFPDAYYIYMTRHPREQGKSVLGAPQALGTLIASDSIDYEVQPPVVDPQFVWYETQVTVLNFLSGIPPERQYRIRGELILAEPEKQLEKICGWLGIAWSQEIYAAMCKTEDGVYANMGPYGCMWGNNPGFQKSPAFRPSKEKSSTLEGPLPWRRDQRPFRPEVVELARELGYR